MVKEILVCGDSFGCGMGIPIESCFEASFGGQIAEHFSVPLNVYARSGCCNYVIYLQIQQVITDYRPKEAPFVLVTTTNHSRFCFPIDTTQGHVGYTLADVDYDSYTPYAEHTGAGRRPKPLENFNKPKLVSETISNVMHFLEQDASNLENFFTSIKTKLETVEKYYKELYDDEIKQTYDQSLILLMHSELKEAGIPHLIMSPNEYRDRFINKENYFYNNWGYYSQKYPDLYGSGHCTEEGHMEVANKIIKRIEGMAQ